MGRGQLGGIGAREMGRGTEGRDLHLRRVRASLSQKLTVPSEPGRVACKQGKRESSMERKWERGKERLGRDVPQVENVPWTGWKEMSLTEYTSDWSLDDGVWSRRWHLKEKLLLLSFSSTYL